MNYDITETFKILRAGIRAVLVAMVTITVILTAPPMLNMASTLWVAAGIATVVVGSLAAFIIAATPTLDPLARAAARYMHKE